MRRFGTDLLVALRSDLLSMVGAVVIAVYCVVALIGPYISHIPLVATPGRAYLGPSWRDPLGTDAFGHSVLAQLIVGTRPIMEVAIIAAVVTIGIGVIVGLVSGYQGGLADAVIMRITDVFLTIPGLPLILVIAALVHSSSPVVLGLILSIQGWAGLARAVRSMALSLRESAFIEAARGQVVPMHHMVGTELLPNVGPFVAMHFLLAISGAVYAEVGLFLLGIAPLSGTNWGIMLNVALSEGALYTARSTWVVVMPMAAIVILQLAFTFLARAMDQVFNPRMRMSA